MKNPHFVTNVDKNTDTVKWLRVCELLGIKSWFGAPITSGDLSYRYIGFYVNVKTKDLTRFWDIINA